MPRVTRSLLSVHLGPQVKGAGSQMKQGRNPQQAQCLPGGLLWGVRQCLLTASKDLSVPVQEGRRAAWCRPCPWRQTAIE